MAYIGVKTEQDITSDRLNKERGYTPVHTFTFSECLFNEHHILFFIYFYKIICSWIRWYIYIFVVCKYNDNKQSESEFSAWVLCKSIIKLCLSHTLFY